MRMIDPIAPQHQHGPGPVAVMSQTSDMLTNAKTHSSKSTVVSARPAISPVAASTTAIPVVKRIATHGVLRAECTVAKAGGTMR